MMPRPDKTAVPALVGLSLMASGLMASGTANALACDFPNFAEYFNRVATSPALFPGTYYLGYGTLARDGPPVTPAVTSTATSTATSTITGPSLGCPDTISANAVFTGGFLNGKALVLQNSYPVKVEIRCLMPGLMNELPFDQKPMLMILRQASDGMNLDIDGCRNKITQVASLQQFKAIQECLKAGICGQGQIEIFSERKSSP